MADGDDEDDDFGANDDDGDDDDDDDCGGDGDGDGDGGCLRGTKMMADTRAFLEALQQWYTTVTWSRWRSHGVI